MLSFRWPATANGALPADPAYPIQLWSWPRLWAVSLGVCTIVALLQATHGYVGLGLAGEMGGGATVPSYEPTWWELLRRTLPTWIWVGTIAPIAVWFARRFPLAPDLSRGHIFLHLLGALAFAALYVAGAASLRYALFVQPVSDTPYRIVVYTYYALYYNSFFVFYWSIAGVYSMVRYYRESQVREVEKVELEAMATKARLDALRRQLHPHFLFNLLNAISSLMLEGNRKDAVHALSDLSHLLRVSFSRNDPFIPLREELEFLDMYVDLHRLRLEDRVQIAYDVDTAAADLVVPTFLLQPLVENAIEHGLARLPEGGTVAVEARIRDTMLEITVTNPLPPSGDRSITISGVGLAITKERIDRSYAGEGEFEFRIESGQAVARVIIPVADLNGRSGNGRNDPKRIRVGRSYQDSLLQRQA